ncbi:hypothetical protein SAMN05216267_1002111 [Actinacidiphila rubida]|uniref:Uncharacterized protein n=2 Tax=Actinacidiphila rubida TaxID=310780 RepID=A0A1H8EB37_9ACTN|nr:hypothetical protein [Actinacidiphila rubida]SEN16693.1 hypothetical protein SAMN05216267_1002111 [Actinacidiphila rubida]
MIGEPEMEPGREPGTAAASGELLGGRGHFGDVSGAGAGPGAGERWRWALGGFALACVLGVVGVEAAGYGRTHAPDLHGYRVGTDLCTALLLQPLVDRMAAQSQTADPLLTRRGSAVDHTSCVMSDRADHGDGWSTDYVVTVTVDLHKKRDPGPEFDDAVRAAAAAPVAGSRLLPLLPPDEISTVSAYPGPGDRAYLISSRSRQVLAVLHGGAEFFLGVDATNDRMAADGEPMAATGSRERPRLPDTTSLRTALPRTMRGIMDALAR